MPGISGRRQRAAKHNLMLKKQTTTGEERLFRQHGSGLSGSDGVPIRYRLEAFRFAPSPGDPVTCSIPLAAFAPKQQATRWRIASRFI
jgi:hypothetical protein